MLFIIFIAQDSITIILEKQREHFGKGQHDKGSVICNHITNRKGVNYLVDLLSINNNGAEREKIDRKTFSVNIVKENTCIIDEARQREIFLFKEALKTKEKCPTLNSGLKESRE